MKRLLSIILIVCLLLAGTAVFAETTEVYKYTVKYNTDCDMVITGTNVVSREPLAEVTLSRITPRKEGFVFMGWSPDTRDYVNETLYLPSQKIEISSSVVLNAIWKDESAKTLTYENEILPSQIIFGEEAQLSEIIPQKSGNTFCGWRIDGAEDDEILLPGEKLSIEGDTVLVPVWESKSLKELSLSVSDTEESDILFEWDGTESYDISKIIVCDLAANTETEYPCQDEELIVELSPGQYKAYVYAEKYGIGYKSNTVNFVAKEKYLNEENSLTVYMDGKLLTFDMPPVLLDGHTFVTLRYFCEYVGSDVYWDASNATAVITYNGKRIKIKEDSDVCVVDGTTYRLPAATRIISSRLFIPLRSVAEFLNCRIVWDASQKVYIFTEAANPFDNNLYYIADSYGAAMSLKDGELVLTKDTGFESMWVFSTVDEELGIYEIYNLCELYKPLEVKMSEVQAGQDVRLWDKSGFDGYLWKLVENTDGSYCISPANHEGYFLDTSNMRLTTDVKKVYLKTAYR